MKEIIIKVSKHKISFLLIIKKFVKIRMKQLKINPRNVVKEYGTDIKTYSVEKKTRYLWLLVLINLYTLNKITDEIIIPKCEFSLNTTLDSWKKLPE